MPRRLQGMNEGQMKAWLETHYDLSGSCWVWKGYKNERGYGVVGWKGKTEQVHRLYWLLSGRTIPDEMHLCHAPVICHNTSCFNPEHLRVDTRSANALDKHADGTMTHAKLTEEQVREIRLDTRTQKTIAADYNVTTATISDIKRGRRWSWVI